MENEFLDKVENNAIVRTCCFTFGEVDMVPTVEEYTALLRCPRIQVDKVYSRAANILAHPDTKKKVDVFALCIYGLVIFPKALGHIDEAVTDLFDQLDRRVTPVPAILAETHFWKVDKVSYKVLSENCSPLKELATTLRRDDITGERWMAILQIFRDEDVEWKAPWMVPDEILYRCRDFDWFHLLGIWGAVGYTPLLVLSKRINDNIPEPNHENNQSIKEHLQVVPSELEIIKQDFEKRYVELEKKIEQMEVEKINLRLDEDVQKLEAERLRKGKIKAEEDLDSLKMDYKKLWISMRTVRLGKTSKQWREEI
ncbi:hypothetical protein Goklo_000103 [Gossypium klotzschianum]|uniref:DUF7745 domain-containing protein n=1 Tax=Gossypium klotzschianum TaxID=34286 RepID=A0A7J8WFN8_9ROSI|nr:hypothetical protein [Gossypium klotzschianum]